MFIHKEATMQKGKGTNLYMEDEIKALLQALAKKTKLSMSNVVKEALLEYRANHLSEKR